jgi:hypothetical protein
MMDLTHALSHLASFYIISLCVLDILASKNLFLVLVYFLLCLKSENRTFSIFIFLSYLYGLGFYCYLEYLEILVLFFFVCKFYFYHCLYFFRKHLQTS